MSTINQYGHFEIARVGPCSPLQRMLILLTLMAHTTCVGATPETVAKQFLKYQYGADGISIQEICHPHDDVWMLRGECNPEGIKAVDSERIAMKDPGVLARVIGQDLCIVEIRQGKVDPSFNLDMVYGLHRGNETS
jgi:hypothetical protein